MLVGVRSTVGKLLPNGFLFDNVIFTGSLLGVLLWLCLTVGAAVASSPSTRLCLRRQVRIIRVNGGLGDGENLEMNDDAEISTIAGKIWKILAGSNKSLDCQPHWEG